jgi:hypothetical protein
MPQSVWRIVNQLEFPVPELPRQIASAMDGCVNGMQPEAIIAAILSAPLSVRLELARALFPDDKDMDHYISRKYEEAANIAMLNAKARA